MWRRLPLLAALPPKTLCALIEVAGPAGPALAKLAAITLPAAAAALRERLTAVVALIERAVPELTLTIDPSRGGDSNIIPASPSPFSPVNRPLNWGRGGRYQANGESAAGATLFMDTVLDVLPGPIDTRRVFSALWDAFRRWAGLRDEGWVTVAGLEPVSDDKVEAGRLACGHLLMAGRVTAAK